MAIKAWIDGDMRLAMRLLQWAQPEENKQRKEAKFNEEIDVDLKAA
ncbi:hypothetical protein EV06_0765 [Prochlorococcus sp. MIT 0602]|nr:hypothetical protein EV06_0765 [Prochlorococcus sp. MIT 0602]KGG18107.1 hypothetical protein EV07_0019 [Prochlorococcus sp. MIT 0603]